MPRLGGGRVKRGFDPANHAAAPISHFWMALSGMTVRGRAFIAAGVTSTAAGVLLDQRDLVRVGVLLLVLPLLAAAFLTRARYRVSAHRRIDRGRAQVGADVRVSIELTNLSRLPTPLLLAQDELPPELGGGDGGARFVVQRVPAGEQRAVSYVMRPTRRGRYSIGPLSVRLTDPFGFCQILRTFTAVDRVTVLPPVTALTAGRLGGQWGAGGAGHSRGLSSGGDQDATTRPYRAGDDRRRVHWRTTARIGELSVRREEQPWQNRAALLIDARAGAHSPGRPSGSFEFAVSAAASIAAALVRSDFGVRLIDDVGRIIAETGGAPFGTGVEAGIAVTEALAEIDRGGNTSLLPVASRLTDQPARRGAIVAVLGRLTPGDVAALAQAAPEGRRRMALLVDADAWTPGSAVATASTGSARDALRRAGWSVAVAHPQTSLESLWRELNVGAGVPGSGVAQRWVG